METLVEGNCTRFELSFIKSGNFERDYKDNSTFIIIYHMFLWIY